MQTALTYAIVPAGPADAAELARVHVQSWRESYRGVLSDGYLSRLSVPLHARRWINRLMRSQEITLAAEGRDGLVGYCSGWQAGGPGSAEAEVTTLYVLKAAQNQGLGRLLLTGVARALAERGASSLVIWVLRDNVRAHGFYERLGGTPGEARDTPVGREMAATVAYRWVDIGALVGG